MNENAVNALKILEKMYNAKSPIDGFEDVSDDVVVYDWTRATATTGKQTLMEQIMGASDRAFSNESFDIEQLVASETGIATVDAIYNAVFVEDYKGIPAHGKPVSWRIRDMYKVESNQITCIWYGGDTLQMLQSLGAVDFKLP